MKQLSTDSGSNQVQPFAPELTQVTAALEEAARVGMPGDVTSLLLADALARGTEPVARIRKVFDRVRAMRVERLLKDGP